MISAGWNRLPVVVRAVLTGTFVSLAGSLPWGVLVKENYKNFPEVPWAVAIEALLLWLFWGCTRNRVAARVNQLSEDAWTWAIIAGVLGLGALVTFFAVVNRLIRLPAETGEGDFSQIPFPTLFAWVIMGAIVAGIVEETSFRGFIQGPIERRHGPVVAIAVTGTLFGFAHFSHPAVTLRMMPYYMSVATIYGAIAYLTNSILPTMVLHSGGNILGSLDLFPSGQSVGQVSRTPAPLIWESGADTRFWVTSIAAAGLTIAAIGAYTILAKTRCRACIGARGA